ncbi:hypothetical protein [Sphingomonas sp.]|uniref:hypothetical protein n=1 Tax=Sphingomonas sp. TaxID=28214 RepID=UPI0031DE7E18
MRLLIVVVAVVALEIGTIFLIGFHARPGIQNLLYLASRRSRSRLPPFQAGAASSSAGPGCGRCSCPRSSVPN